MPRNLSSEVHLTPRAFHDLTGEWLHFARPLVSLWQQHRYRKELAWLRDRDPRLIRDIGLSVENVEGEVTASHWRSPYLPDLRLF